MTLQEAKEQIAKEAGYTNWYSVESSFEQEYLSRAYELILSSKDKQIEELKEKCVSLQDELFDKENNPDYKSELSQLKEEYSTVWVANASSNSHIVNLNAKIQSLQEENIKLAGELKYFTDKFPHNELGWKTKLENEINSLREEMKKKEEEIRLLKYPHTIKEKKGTFCDNCGRIDCSCTNLRKH